MQYPQFQRDGWPIGSGMVESANKNVVEARLKGTGMHWQRKNVNPMLALRNAVCNDRWKEMWQKAILQKRSLQAHIRSTRGKPGAQALVEVDHSPSVESPPVQPARAEEPSAPLSSRVSVTPRPPSRRLSSWRKQHAAHNRVKYAQHRSDHEETCFCGTPFVQPTGGGRRKYCSDICRLHAFRQRQRDCKPARAESAGTLPASSHPIAHHREIDCPSASICPTGLPQNSGKMSGGCGVCGTPLAQPIAGPAEKYCSDRCRLRAYKDRHAS